MHQYICIFFVRGDKYRFCNLKGDSIAWIHLPPSLWQWYQYHWRNHALACRNKNDRKNNKNKVRRREREVIRKRGYFNSKCLGTGFGYCFFNVCTINNLLYLNHIFNHCYASPILFVCGFINPSFIIHK